MKKEYTYDEWLNLSREIKDWTTRISRWDNRPYHPEDYVGYAEELLKKANNNQVIAWALFERVRCLSDNAKCHTDGMYSFLDFWQYIVGKSIINESLEAYRRGDYMTSEELLEQTRKRLTQ